MIILKENDMMRIVVILLVMVLSSCSGSKKAITVEELNELETFVRNGDFTFEANSAFPRLSNSLVQISNAVLLAPNSTAGRIDLIGNPGYITFKNDSINMYLPYFGERQMGGGYGNQNGGIIFKGKPKDLSIGPDTKNTSLKIQFTGVDGTESYRVIMNIFPNKKSNVYVTSSHRFPIGYSGEIKETAQSKKTAESVFN